MRSQRPCDHIRHTSFSHSSDGGTRTHFGFVAVKSISNTLTILSVLIHSGTSKTGLLDNNIQMD